MTEPQHKKKFLKLPQYPGGSKAFKEFIAGNLIYPGEAVEAGIEGSVLVGYEINDNGEVLNPHIIKGLGHGCDEEALRLVRMLVYEKARNRGLRVKVNTKTRINFKLKKTTYTYSTVSQKSPDKKKEAPVTYEYTIKF